MYVTHRSFAAPAPAIRDFFWLCHTYSLLRGGFYNASSGFGLWAKTLRGQKSCKTCSVEQVWGHYMTCIYELRYFLDAFLKREKMAAPNNFSRLCLLSYCWNVQDFFLSLGETQVKQRIFEISCIQLVSFLR